MDMKIRYGISGFFLAALAVLVSPAGLYGEERVHVVQKGETFYSIGRSLGVGAEDLMKYNGISDPARLQAGQRLKIPGAAPVKSAGTATAGGGNYTDYRVVRGDTLYGIARKFSVTLEALRKINSLPENYTLRVGDSLRVPQASSPAVPAEAARSTASSPEKAAPRETETRTVDDSISWPVSVRELSYMTGKLSGVVITGARAEPVKSLTQGTVISAGPYRGFGRVVIVQTGGGYLYVYGGCENLSVREGDKVGSGTELGKLGIDAVSNKPQLFFMVYRSNAPVDPAKAPRA
jgi:murein DD-endopeptidase MepM/ murein hydrolase activator NlpD